MSDFTVIQYDTTCTDNSEEVGHDAYLHYSHMTLV